MKRYLDEIRKIQKAINEVIDDMENQPDFGWESVKKDDLIMVRNNINQEWRYAHFNAITMFGVDKIFWVYSNGKTSKTSGINDIERVKFAKVTIE